MSIFERQPVLVIFVSLVNCSASYRLEGATSSPPCSVQPRLLLVPLVLFETSKRGDLVLSFLEELDHLGLCFKQLCSNNSQPKLSCDAFRFHNCLWSFQKIKVPRAQPKLAHLESVSGEASVCIYMCAHVCFKGPCVILIALEIVLKLFFYFPCFCD